MGTLIKFAFPVKYQILNIFQSFNGYRLLYVLYPKKIFAIKNSNFKFRKYSKKTIKCWNCGQTGSELFCEKCFSIQESKNDLNYFEIMDLPVKYDINDKELVQNFRKLQSLLHPDKFSNKPEKEQMISGIQSSLVNNAFSTLKNPVKRGFYLLKLNGVRLEDNEIPIDTKFLAEILELNETIEETNDIKKLKQLFHNNKLKIEDLCSKLSKAFENKQIDKAKHILKQLKYYVNIDNQLKEKLPIFDEI